jgi:hypothetical protein
MTRMRALVAVMFVGACAPPRAPHPPVAARCTVRATARGLFVDGERMSRGEAVAYCRRTTEGAVVILDEDPAHGDATRDALEREGVRVYVRGPLCHDPRPRGCRPQIAAPRPSVTPRPVVAPAPTPPR